MVRSGEIDELSDADTVESLVASARDLNSHTAGALLLDIVKISMLFERALISVSGSEIFVKVPASDLRLAQIKLASIGVLKRVTIDVTD